MSTDKQEVLAKGLRFNTGKTPLHLISWATITELAKVLEFGAKKYAARNWEKGLSFADTFASLQRHAIAWFNGEDKDPETGLSHAAHMMCNSMFLLHFILTGTGTDDRPHKLSPETNKEQYDATIPINPEPQPGAVVEVGSIIPAGEPFPSAPGVYVGRAGDVQLYNDERKPEPPARKRRW